MWRRKDSISSRLTWDYVRGLLLLAALSAATLVVERRVMQSGMGLSEVINTSGRQRMLSQRIAGMALQHRDGDETAREELLAAIGQMDLAERKTAEPYRVVGKGEANHILHDIYFEGEQPLDGEVHTFLDSARLVAGSQDHRGERDAPLRWVVAEARGRLLARLNTVVGIHQRDAEESMRNLARMEAILFGVMLLTLLLEGIYLFRPMVEKVIAYSESLIALTNTDQLTGAANRRGFEERSRVEVARSQRYKRPLTVLVLDVDHFKKVNDAYGHPAGDAVLARLVTCLQGQVRPIDMVGRLGREEFGLLLPETDLANAAHLAERLRKVVSELAIEYDGQTIPVTVSIGVAAISAQSMGFEGGLKVADRLLYRAKQTGRNRVVWREDAAVGGVGMPLTLAGGSLPA